MAITTSDYLQQQMIDDYMRLAAQQRQALRPYRASEALLKAEEAKQAALQVERSRAEKENLLLLIEDEST